MQLIPGALSLEVKQPGRELNHPSPASAEVTNTWSYTSTLPYVIMARCSVEHGTNFSFVLFLYGLCREELASRSFAKSVRLQDAGTASRHPILDSRLEGDRSNPVWHTGSSDLGSS
jgi:hypothetical protein